MRDYSIRYTHIGTGERVAKDSNVVVRNIDGEQRSFVKVKTPITTIPFVKKS
jgi:phospho-N-acetylmuramoyl-pentapeptide-transferase